MRLRALLVAFSLFVLSLTLSIPVAAQIETRPILSSSAAMTMVHGCLSKAAAEGWFMHIAIMDNHGNLKAYHRMDDAQLLSHDVAMAKARTSAASPRSTKQWGEMAFASGPSAAAFVPGLNFFEGGLPILTDDGQHLGGIGVSGDPGANDALCAQAGIDAVADQLQ